MSSPETEEERDLKNFNFDDTRFDAGLKTGFDRQRQGAVESLADVTNPYTRARMQQILFEDIGANEASAQTAAEKERNALSLQNKQFLAGLRRPQYITTGMTGSGMAEQQNQSSGILNSLISGGLGLAAAFA